MVRVRHEFVLFYHHTYNDVKTEPLHKCLKDFWFKITNLASLEETLHYNHFIPTYLSDFTSLYDVKLLCWAQCLLSLSQLKKAYWMNNIAVSCMHCYSCQMCPNGIRTSSIMTLVCFKLFAPSLFLSVSPLETGHVGSYQWGESLPQRHRLHPSGETTQSTRSESTRTRENLHGSFTHAAAHSIPPRQTAKP